jgi:hypothetical protein
MSDKPVETCTVVLMTSKRHGGSCPILVCTGPDQAERAAKVVDKFRSRGGAILDALRGDTFEAIDGVALNEL